VAAREGSWVIVPLPPFADEVAFELTAAR